LEPLVSVICITRNHEHFCIESLNSVLNQTYKNIEWIILDAASTDNTVGLIDNWLFEKNVKAVFLKEKELKYLPINLNKALSFAHGEYVQFLSLDDVLLDHKFRVQVELLQNNPSCIFTYSDCNIIDENGAINIKTSFEINNIISPPSGFIFPKLFELGYFTNTPTILWSRKKLIEIGKFNENYQLEDLDFVYRATLKFKVIYCDKITLKYRILISSLSHNPSLSFLMNECEIKIDYFQFSNKSIYSRVYKEIIRDAIKIYKNSNFKNPQFFFKLFINIPNTTTILLLFCYLFKKKYTFHNNLVFLLNKHNIY
jgi:glycosyltransferase involved in cell wall biosynthesis